MKKQFPSLMLKVKEKVQTFVLHKLLVDLVFKARNLTNRSIVTEICGDNATGMIAGKPKGIGTGEEPLMRGEGGMIDPKGQTEKGNVVGAEEDSTKMQMIYDTD